MLVDKVGRESMWWYTIGTWLADKDSIFSNKVEKMSHFDDLDDLNEFGSKKIV